ncbi:STAS domain-containing protein [Streptomyces sp. WAC 04229]|uniref:STAS domain-containing protein n=1 Tax=Streptomyces sp. WAC 04229 TaxID=2203206 RepID=UPI003D70C3D7
MTPSPDADPVALQPATSPHTVRLALHGDLDYDNGDDVLRAVQRALSDHQDVRDLYLDCQALKTVDSFGLSILLLIHRLAGREGTSLHLDNISPTLKRLLDVTGTYEHLAGPPPAAPTAGPDAGATSDP